MSSTIPLSQLPASDSPSLVLIHPTPEERLKTWEINGASWRGPLSLDAYLRREEHLANQPLTRNGGVTFWILVDINSAANARVILSSCESYRKHALVKRQGEQVKKAISHGIGSVFCNPQLRGRGYAARMFRELGKQLETWQQLDGQKADFSVLYSDIGKKFYSRLGWEAFPSRHIALNPMVENKENQLTKNEFPRVYSLYAKDLTELCHADELKLNAVLENSMAGSSCVSVALVPDVNTIQWHHAREEFLAQELVGRWPDIKGAIAQGSEGERVWGIWTRTFGSEENTLNILRLFIEVEGVSFETSDEVAAADTEASKRNVLAVASVIRSACYEAAEWGMDNLQFWNPTPITIQAAREIEPSVKIIDRTDDSIASLRWHGPQLDSRCKLQWVANQKYGWC